MFSERIAVSCHEKTDCINKNPTRMILVLTNGSCCAPAQMRKMSRVYAAGIHTVYVDEEVLFICGMDQNLTSWLVCVCYMYVSLSVFRVLQKDDVNQVRQNTLAYSVVTL